MPLNFINYVVRTHRQSRSILWSCIFSTKYAERDECYLNKYTQKSSMRQSWLFMRQKTLVGYTVFELVRPILQIPSYVFFYIISGINDHSLLILTLKHSHFIEMWQTQNLQSLRFEVKLWKSGKYLQKLVICKGNKRGRERGHEEYFQLRAVYCKEVCDKSRKNCVTHPCVRF